MGPEGVRNGRRLPVRGLQRIDYAVEATGLAERTIRDLMYRKAIPYVKLPSGATRFDPVELQTWIDSGRVPVEP